MSIEAKMLQLKILSVPEDKDEKIFQDVCLQTYKLIGDPYSYNDWIRKIVKSVNKEDECQ